MWLQAHLELLGKIQQPTPHPAGRFHRLSRHVMVGIFLVVAPGIIAENRIHLEQTEQEDQPPTKLCSRYIVETMIAIAQIIGLLEADGLDQSCSVTLVRQHRLSQG